VVWEGRGREAPPYPDLWPKADELATRQVVSNLRYTGRAANVVQRRPSARCPWARLLSIRLGIRHTIIAWQYQPVANPCRHHVAPSTPSLARRALHLRRCTAAAAERIKAKSFTIDGEAVALGQRGKFVPTEKFEDEFGNLRAEAEDLLFDANAVQPSSLRRNAAVRPAWYWLSRNGLDQLIRTAVQRGFWREKDGLVAKKWEWRTRVTARQDDFEQDAMVTGEFHLIVTPEKAELGCARRQWLWALKRPKEPVRSFCSAKFWVQQLLQSARFDDLDA
jgi:hypothetical protein